MCKSEKSWLFLIIKWLSFLRTEKKMSFQNPINGMTRYWSSPLPLTLLLTNRLFSPKSSWWEIIMHNFLVLYINFFLWSISAGIPQSQLSSHSALLMILIAYSFNSDPTTWFLLKAKAHTQKKIVNQGNTGSFFLADLTNIAVILLR